MRDIIEVIERIVEYIPEDKKLFITQLNSIKNSAMYTPPEAMHGRWYEASCILENNLGQVNQLPKDGWEMEVLKEWKDIK